MNRYLLALAGIIFTVEHPYLVAFASVIYVLNQIMTTEEKVMLRDSASNGTLWLSNLNTLSRNKGLKMKEGREIVSNVTETLFNNVPSEDLKRFFNDVDNQDKVNKFIIDELAKKETAEIVWEEYPLGENDLVGEEFKLFIERYAPDFDFTKDYTFKSHRQLFKTIKSKFRNTDGSINDQKANDLTLYLEALLYGGITQTDIPAFDSELDCYLLSLVYPTINLETANV